MSPFTSYATAAFVAAFHIQALAQSPAVAPRELSGSWERTAVTIGNVPLPTDKVGATLVINGAAFEMGSDWAGTLKADSVRRTIDLTFTAAKNQGQTWRGIYAADRGTLKMRFVSEPKKPRPATFATNGGGRFGDMDYTLMTFRKAP